jgi:hypothetical protein
MSGTLEIRNPDLKVPPWDFEMSPGLFEIRNPDLQVPAPDFALFRAQPPN